MNFRTSLCVSLLALAGMGRTFAQPVAVSLWKGEGSPVDSIGSNNAEEIGSVEYSTGQDGLGFDLSGAYLNVPSPQDGGLTSATGFTVAAWIREDTLVSAAPIMNLRTSENKSGFTLENLFGVPGSVMLAVNLTGIPEDFEVLTSTGWVAGELHHIAATFDSAEPALRIYRDGLPVACRHDIEGQPMALLGTESFWIGRNIVAGFNWDGLLDEVQYFDVALTEEEVRLLVGIEAPCDGDANRDGAVDPLDAGHVLARLGCGVASCDPGCVAADQNSDGIVDPLDVGFVLSRFGSCQ